MATMCSDLKISYFENIFNTLYLLNITQHYTFSEHSNSSTFLKIFSLILLTGSGSFLVTVHNSKATNLKAQNKENIQNLSSFQSITPS